MYVRAHVFWLQREHNVLNNEIIVKNLIFQNSFCMSVKRITIYDIKIFCDAGNLIFYSNKSVATNYHNDLYC